MPEPDHPDEGDMTVIRLGPSPAGRHIGTGLATAGDASGTLAAISPDNSVKIPGNNRTQGQEART